METGTIACRLFILLSCRGEKSLKLDGQHNADAPVTLALTALSNIMTHTPLSYTNPHRCRTTKGMSQKERLFSAECCRGCAVEVNGDRRPEYR